MAKSVTAATRPSALPCVSSRQLRCIEPSFARNMTILLKRKPEKTGKSAAGGVTAGRLSCRKANFASAWRYSRLLPIAAAANSSAANSWASSNCRRSQCISGCPQCRATVNAATNRHGASCRAICANSCASTAFNSAGDHSRHPAGSITVGRHQPTTAALSKSLVSRTCGKWRSGRQGNSSASRSDTPQSATTVLRRRRAAIATRPLISRSKPIADPIAKTTNAQRAAL